MVSRKKKPEPDLEALAKVVNSRSGEPTPIGKRRTNLNRIVLKMVLVLGVVILLFSILYTIWYSSETREKPILDEELTMSSFLDAPGRINYERVDRSLRNLPPPYDYEGEQHALRHIGELRAAEALAEQERLASTPPPAEAREEAPRAAPPPPAPVAQPAPSVGVWDRLAACESGGNWAANTGNGYSGGLQWLPSTWRAAGGTRFTEYAWQASREQEITIAEEWLARTSWAQWPACSRKLGLR